MSKKEELVREASVRETGKKGISTEKIVSPGDAFTYLEEVAKCLKQGRLVVSRGGDSFVLDLPDTESVKLKLDVKQKKDKVKVEFGLTWQQMAAADDGEELRVSATAPRVPIKKTGVAAGAAKPKDGPPVAGSVKKGEDRAKPEAVGKRRH